MVLDVVHENNEIVVTRVSAHIRVLSDFQVFRRSMAGIVHDASEVFVARAGRNYCMQAVNDAKVGVDSAIGRLVVEPVNEI